MPGRCDATPVIECLGLTVLGDGITLYHCGGVPVRCVVEMDENVTMTFLSRHHYPDGVPQGIWLALERVNADLGVCRYGTHDGSCFTVRFTVPFECLAAEARAMADRVVKLDRFLEDEGFC